MAAACWVNSHKFIGDIRQELGGFSCDCDEGYEGALCQYDTDDCSSDPCMNNGTCADRVANYTCSCLPG